MARVFYAARALTDFERLFEFLAAHDPETAAQAVSLIVDAISVLARHPNIGRPVRGKLRELVISHGRTGYVALYRVQGNIDRVEILSLRHQREAGFSA
jgi:plasmid stabilization system protein ParE